jgi:hypothetical protein
MERIGILGYLNEAIGRLETLLYSFRFLETASHVVVTGFSGNGMLWYWEYNGKLRHFFEFIFFEFKLVKTKQ